MWDALRGIVGLDARRFVSSGPAPAALPMYRRPTGMAAAAMASAASEHARAEPDDVDLLFRGRIDPPASA